jgi:hypothetical protein
MQTPLVGKQLNCGQEGRAAVAPHEHLVGATKMWDKSNTFKADAERNISHQRRIELTSANLGEHGNSYHVAKESSMLAVESQQACQAKEGTSQAQTEPLEAHSPAWTRTESPYESESYASWSENTNPIELAYSAEANEPLFQEVAKRLGNIREWCKDGGGSQPDTFNNFMLLCNSAARIQVDDEFYSNVCQCYGKFDLKCKLSGNSNAVLSSMLSLCTNRHDSGTGKIVG